MNSLQFFAGSAHASYLTANFFVAEASVSNFSQADIVLISNTHSESRQRILYNWLVNTFCIGEKSVAFFEGNEGRIEGVKSYMPHVQLYGWDDLQQIEMEGYYSLVMDKLLTLIEKGNLPGTTVAQMRQILIEIGETLNVDIDLRKIEKYLPYFDKENLDILKSIPKRLKSYQRIAAKMQKVSPARLKKKFKALAYKMILDVTYSQTLFAFVIHSANRNHRMVENIHKAVNEEKKVFLIAGENHFIKEKVEKPVIANLVCVDILKQGLAKKKFVILTPNTQPEDLKPAYLSIQTAIQVNNLSNKFETAAPKKKMYDWRDAERLRERIMKIFDYMYPTAMADYTENVSTFA